MRRFRPFKPRTHGTTPEVIKRGYDQVGGEKQVEVVLSPIKQSQVYAYAETDDSERRQRLSFDQARKLTRAGGLAFPEALAADAGGYFVPPPDDDADINELMARGESAHGQMIGEWFRNADREGFANANPELLLKVREALSSIAAALGLVEKRLAP